MSARKYAPDERPLFAFCEPVHAGPLRPWCIRRVGPEGLKLGGGITSGPLCQRWACNGWDLNVRVLPEHFAGKAGARPTVCPECAEEYKAAVAGGGSHA